MVQEMAFNEWPAVTVRIPPEGHTRKEGKRPK